MTRRRTVNRTGLPRGEPIVNRNIDVNACVTRFLKVRERSNLKKRLDGLRKLFTDYTLVGRLSQQNRKMLGL